MSMLRHKMKGAGPEERLVLALYLRRFDGVGAVRLRVADLAACLGVSPGVIMRSMSKLSANDACLSVKTVPVSRGRPSRSYEVSPLFRARLSEVTKVSLPPVCMQVVEHLLSVPKRGAELGSGGSTGKSVGYRQPPVRKESDQLTIANRWLLAVLVSHASELGVVQGLGLSALRQLTGMSELRLKAQLQRLVELGVIRSYVRGISSALFTETKVSTTYFLNLNHSCLGQRGDGCAVVVIQEKGEGRRLAVNMTALPVVEQYFRQLKDEAFDVFLWRLDGYASFLLSTRWRELGRLGSAELTQALQDMISADFRRPVGRSADALDIDERNWSRIIEHFCWLALERAKDIRKLLERMPAGDLDGVRIQLIPAPCKGSGTQVTMVTTLLMERSPVPRYGCLVIKYHPWKVCRLYRDEAELSVPARCRFGLQARP
ncbi:TPA: hypothetical protein L6A06_13120 [Pseudomonas aeruginosa]|nr:hypothetical protein T266_16290 [Pseudomonas aeruginosa VRFPA05]KSQ11866.1 hypothetical protein APB28_29815 [Pseudomonas aeruginosa]RPW70527.1 hypothetical protein IPC737_22790 [Pseudomonas aeruginosa]VFS88790.1 Uncharacterised protein [Pseudomonas aeruginosa]HBP5924533.1 hypothetical protein [Pseudomonas aeruginosa]